MPKSILEAIKEGHWDYEPAEIHSADFDGADAMPGTWEKVEILAQRVRTGLPLWHPGDRDDVDTPPFRRPR